jgi:hypothetical protein
MKNGVSWYVTLCGSCENWHFGGMCSLDHQGEMNQWGRYNVSSNLELKHTAKECDNVPLKCWFSQEPHGVTSQKTEFCMFVIFTTLQEEHMLDFTNTDSLQMLWFLLVELCMVVTKIKHSEILNMTWTKLWLLVTLHFLVIGNLLVFSVIAFVLS